jgi:uncharacterized integral membrane protein
MALGYLVAALAATIVAIFALQNGAPTTVRFLTWTVEAVPLAGVVLIALAAGLVVTGLPLALRVWRWRSRARALEARVTALEKNAAESRPRMSSGQGETS